MEEKVLIITTSKGTFRILHSDIIRVEADGVYSHIYTMEKIHCVCLHLKIIQGELKSSKYLYKIHRSHIINVDKIKNLTRKEKACFLIMCDGSEIPVAKREKGKFMKYYQTRKRILVEEKQEGKNNFQNKFYSVLNKEVNAVQKMLFSGS